MSIIIGVIEEGLIYAIMALGLYITYKILDFPDLSVDGTFPMGAAVTAMLILKGVHPALTLVLSFAAGLLAGTGLSVKEVAAAAGCTDPNYLAKLQKRRLGRTPTELRNEGR